MPSNLDFQHIAMVLLAFVVAITLHEFGHAIAADLLGDDTPRRQGRLTINPIDHLDPVGTIVLIVALVSFGMGFGWGRPVQINTNRFKNPRAGDAIVSIAGPIMNLIQAVLFATIMRTGFFHLPPDSPYIELITIAFSLNVILFVFNLVPIPPLDGSHILAAILPQSMSDGYKQAMASFGWVLFFVFVFFGIQLIMPAVAQIQDILLNASILM